MLTRALAAAALLLLSNTAPVPPAATSAAPLLMPNMPLHDPWIVADRASGTYWLFTRNERAMTGDGQLGIMAYCSRDLWHWQRSKLVFTLPPGTWANDGA